MNLLSTLAFSSQVLGKRYTKINTYSVYASFPFLFTDVKCIIGHIYNISQSKYTNRVLRSRTRVSTRRPSDAGDARPTDIVQQVRREKELSGGAT